jgi:hypothetical protein
MRAMRSRGLFSFALGFAILAVGCGVAGDDHEDETEATLAIAPASVELLVLNGVPATQSYTATLTFPDGFEKDVTAETYFSVDTAFGSFTGATAAIVTAGKTTALAQRNDKTATGIILARVQSTRVDPALDPTTPDLFDSLPEDVARAPTVVYPAENVIMPRNLGDFEAHWTDASGNDVFELSLTTEFSDVRVYLPGGNGNQAAGPMASFGAFLATEWLSAVGLQPNVRYQVRGISSTNPTSVGAAPARTVELSNERLEGGLYYWAAASVNGPDGIYRHDMAKPGQQAEQFFTRAQTPLDTNGQARCVACHVLSRDGTKMAVTYDGGNGNGTMVDVASATPQTDNAPWNFATFTPDGNQFLAVFQGTLTVRSSLDQGAVATMPADGPVTHPDLSPDGTRLVYVRKASPAQSDWDFTGGQLFTRTYDQASRTFGPEVMLVPDGGNNFYPSWSPDGQWILFNRSTDNGDAYDNGNASLFVIKADGTGTAIELASANAGLGLTNSWGRWAPFQQSIGLTNEPIFWVTVSSKRNFGVRLFQAARPQIWMTPFFPTRAMAAGDPSVAAFRLPFQNIDSNNHIAQWTERVVGTF